MLPCRRRPPRCCVRPAVERDAPEAAAVDVLDAVVFGEALVDERVVRPQQIEHAAILADHAFHEHLRLAPERLAEVVVEVGEQPHVGRYVQGRRPARARRRRARRRRRTARRPCSRRRRSGQRPRSPSRARAASASSVRCWGVVRRSPSVAPAARRSWRARMSGATRARRSATALTSASRSAGPGRDIDCIVQRMVPPPPARRRASPAVTLGLLAVACVSYVLQQTLVVPALPTIQRDLDTTTTWVTWVFTGFLLASAVATPLLGKLGDTYGKKRLLVVVMLIFLVGTIGAALANSIAALIAARALQGAAARCSRSPSGSCATSSRRAGRDGPRPAVGHLRRGRWGRPRPERGHPREPALDLALLDRRGPGRSRPRPGLAARARVARADAVAARLEGRAHAVGGAVRAAAGADRGGAVGLDQRRDARRRGGVGRAAVPLGLGRAAGARADG